MTALKMTTFNIRYDCKMDGINNFEYRKPLILKKIKEESPDLIGFQEVLPHVLGWLKENLEDYDIVGCGRGADYQDEAGVIAYKKACFNLVGLEVFWLSETPQVPGSRFEKQSMCPRICTVATLKHHEMGQPIRLYNTHLDHESSEARVLGMSSILEKMKKDQEVLPLPVIFTGDFNAEPDAAEIQMIQGKGQLRDITEQIDYTYHEFGKPEEYVKIDYIYVSKAFEVEEVVSWKDVEEGVYLSDHHPVAALCRIQ